MQADDPTYRTHTGADRWDLALERLICAYLDRVSIGLEVVQNGNLNIMVDEAASGAEPWSTAEQIAVAMEHMANGRSSRAHEVLGSSPRGSDPGEVFAWIVARTLIDYEQPPDQAVGVLDQLLDLAKNLDGPGVASFALSSRPMNSRQSEGADVRLRELAQAAELAPKRSATRCLPLLLTVADLCASGAFDAAELVLDQINEELPWPGFARTRLDRLRLRIKSRREGPVAALDAAEAMADGRIDLANSSVRSPAERVQYRLLVASLHAQLGDSVTARNHFESAMAERDRAEVDGASIRLDAAEADLWLCFAEGAHTDLVERSSAYVADPAYVHITRLARELTIDALEILGRFDEAWALSNARFDAERNVSLGGWFKLQIELADAHARQGHAAEIEDRYRELAEIEGRVSAVLAGLAHGINDPLTVFQIWLEAFVDSTPVEGVPAAAALERLARLLDQVLWMVRLSGGVAMVANLSTDAISGAVRAAIAGLHEWTQYREIEVVVTKQVEAPASGVTEHEVRDDRAGSDAVKTLLESLLVYAAGYAPKGSVVEVGLRRDANGLVVEVTDTGSDLLETGSTRPGVAPGLSTRRAGGGDATADIALLVAEQVAHQLGTVIECDQQREKVFASCRIPPGGS